jgi:hypothetical protein
MRDAASVISGSVWSPEIRQAHIAKKFSTGDGGRDDRSIPTPTRILMPL